MNSWTVVPATGANGEDMLMFSLKPAARRCICAAPLAFPCSQRLGRDPRAHETASSKPPVPGVGRGALSFCSVNNLLSSAQLSRSPNVHNVGFFG